MIVGTVSSSRVSGRSEAIAQQELRQPLEQAHERMQAMWRKKRRRAERPSAASRDEVARDGDGEGRRDGLARPVQKCCKSREPRRAAQAVLCGRRRKVQLVTGPASADRASECGPAGRRAAAARWSDKLVLGERGWALEPGCRKRGRA